MTYQAKLSILLSFIITFIISAQSQAAELISLETRPGVNQKFILIKSDKPLANVILFTGGRGTLKLTSFLGVPSLGGGTKNFLVRSRDKFAKHGFMVAVVDAPSDYQGEKGMLDGFRNSKQHVADIDKVIDYLRKENDGPVWLVGTSRGTESATRVAISSAEKPDGLILTSSMSRPNKGGTSVTEMELHEINIPTLIIAHRDDKCKYTPPEGAEEIKNGLSNAQRIEVKYLDGGKNPRSGPCGPFSAHGFFGIEDYAVDAIAHFIKTNR